MSKHNYKMGLLPDKKDERDYKLSPFLFKDVQAASSSNLFANFPQIRDQGNLGSCTGHGSYAAMEFLHKVMRGQFIGASPLFPYNMGRLSNGCLDEDTGLSIRDVIKALAKYGICTETLLPYVEDNFYKEPSAAAKADGATRQAIAYYRIKGFGAGGVDLARKVLTLGHPIIIGATLFEDSMKAAVKTGVFELPASADKVAGDHCVTIGAHDDSTERFRHQGSWGLDVGLASDLGRFEFSYDYYEKYVSDAWALVKSE